MKKFEINAFSLDEAKSKALDLGITVERNVTPSFKAAAPVVDFDAFATEQLVKNHFDNATGVGCIVVVEAGSADTRERPYEYVNNVVDGSLQKKRIFAIYADDKMVGEADTKADAARLAKELIKTYHSDLVCKQMYKVLGDHELAFTLKYTPSSNTKEGKYIVFGN